jgi:osmoprotectant transport system permease protein
MATVTVAAYLPFLGGLGRFIKDGAGALYDLQAGYPAMVAAGITVAVLAVLVDGLLNLVQRFTVSPGLTGRVKPDKPVATGDPATTAPAEVDLIAA